MTDMPVIDTKEKYGVAIHLHDFGQAVFEQYQTETIKASRDAFFQFSQEGAGVTATAAVRGKTVRTAIRLKIVTGITAEDVDSMKPYIVEWLADMIKAHVVSIVSAPADPN